jgi:predicted O-methyltransferase YrrM
MINKISKEDLKEFITFYKTINPSIDEELFFMAGEAYGYKITNLYYLKDLFRIYDKWVTSLKNGTPDYSVYGEDFYLIELWYSWITYSRSYLKLLEKNKFSENKKLIIDNLNDLGIDSILDIGSGPGYTTSSLKTLFPHAEVYACEYKESFQYKMATELSKKYNFEVISALPEKHIDLIFASEYFEHIEAPIEHLQDIINKCSPKIFIVANAFGQPAIGHFEQYIVNNQKIDGKKMNKMFSKQMSVNNYKRVKTNCWNDRPSFWIKGD